MASPACIAVATPIANVDHGNFADVFFEKARSDVQKKYQVELKTHVEAVFRTFPQDWACAIVTGHADTSEDPVPGAVALSSERANAVGTVLKELKIPRTRVFLEYRGATQSVIPPPDTRNQRAEISFVPCGEKEP